MLYSNRLNYNINLTSSWKKESFTSGRSFQSKRGCEVLQWCGWSPPWTFLRWTGAGDKISRLRLIRWPGTWTSSRRCRGGSSMTHPSWTWPCSRGYRSSFFEVFSVLNQLYQCPIYRSSRTSQSSSSSLRCCSSRMKKKLLPDVDKVFKKYGTFPDLPLYSVDLLDEE